MLKIWRAVLVAILWGSGLCYGAPFVAVVNSHLTGELNSLLAIANGLGYRYKIIEAEQLELLDENPDIILHALGNPEEIEEIKNFKLGHPETKVVNLADPLANHSIFDAIVYPAHLDKTPSPKNIVVEGVPSPISSDQIEREAERMRSSLQPSNRMKIAVFVGGNAKGSVFTEKHAQALARNVMLLKEKYNAQIYVTGSRRTSEAAWNAFRMGFKFDLEDHFFSWAQAEEFGNPYKAIMGLADYVVVTGDSMSMIADSIKIGKPTFVFAPEGSLETRHKLFIIQQAKQGRVRPLSSTLTPYSYSPLDTAQQIVMKLKQALKLEVAGTNHHSCQAHFQ